MMPFCISLLHKGKMVAGPNDRQVRVRTRLAMPNGIPTWCDSTYLYTTLEGDAHDFMHALADSVARYDLSEIDTDRPAVTSHQFMQRLKAINSVASDWSDAHMQMKSHMERSAIVRQLCKYCKLLSREGSVRVDLLPPTMTHPFPHLKVEACGTNKGRIRFALLSKEERTSQRFGQSTVSVNINNPRFVKELIIPLVRTWGVHYGGRWSHSWLQPGIWEEILVASSHFSDHDGDQDDGWLLGSLGFAWKAPPPEPETAPSTPPTSMDLE